MQREAERGMQEQPPVEMVTVQSTAWSGAAGIVTEQQKLHPSTQERLEDSLGKDLAKLMLRGFLSHYWAV